MLLKLITKHLNLTKSLTASFKLQYNFGISPFLKKDKPKY